MFRYVTTGIALTFVGSLTAHAHTTENIHPHPHSMDLMAIEGVTTVALMFVALALVAVARHLVTPKRKSIDRHRGQQ